MPTIADYMFFELFVGAEHDLCKREVKAANSDADIIGFCLGIKRRCFLKCYKLFPKIETLPEAEKKELKDFVIKNFPGKSKAELVENCKIIYTAGMLIK